MGRDESKMNFWEIRKCSMFFRALPMTAILHYVTLSLLNIACLPTAVHCKSYLFSSVPYFFSNCIYSYHIWQTWECDMGNRQEGADDADLRPTF